jgi:hypothetical protein
MVGKLLANMVIQQLLVALQALEAHHLVLRDIF